MTIVKRPLEVTIVAWIALAAAVVRLFTYAGVLFIPEAQENLVSMGIHKSEKALLQFPLSIHYLFSGVGIAIFMAAGIGLLRARNWARITLALWSGWILLFAFLTTGSFVYVAPKLLVFVVMLVILFSPRAKAYLSVDQD